MSLTEKMLSDGLPVPEMGANVQGRKVFQHRELVAPIRSAVLEPEECEKQAAHLRDSTASMFMFASMRSVVAGLDMASCRIFRDQLVADYGHTSDPVAIMLLEQLALAHLNICQLCGKASSESSVQCATAYLAASTRLMGEFRRTALALPAYREAVQRLEGGVAAAEECPRKKDSDSELQMERRSDESRTATPRDGDPWNGSGTTRSLGEAPARDAG
jgi:hypothetical protein